VENATVENGAAFEGIAAIARQFRRAGAVTGAREFGSGNINDTYIVTVDAPQAPYFVLQRIAKRVFPQPELVAKNTRVVTEHIGTRLREFDLGRRWEVPRVLPTQTGADYWQDSNGDTWRAIDYIADSYTLNAVADTDRAREVGYAIGLFHRLLSDLPVARLSDPLPGFHVTPRYLARYDRVAATATTASSAETRFCTRCIETWRDRVTVLEDAAARGELPLRPIHGDPKVNNVLLDKTTERAVSVIDLDTVKPGLIHYDIGDCLRSGCNPLGEDCDRWESVCFETELAVATLEGYLQHGRYFLNERDRAYFVDAAFLIAFELGLRFFTDYLEGNVYFKVARAEHNLARALVQFKLAASICDCAETLRSLS